MSESTADVLLRELIHQKVKLREKAGEKDVRPMPTAKAKSLYGAAIAKMAEIVDRWHTNPALAMEACFAWARRCKHFDGPQLNMLGSEKYLTSALAFHLELPKESLRDRVSLGSLLERHRQTALEFEVQIRRYLVAKYGTDDRLQFGDPDRALSLEMFGTVPALYRFLYTPASKRVAYTLIPEILDALADDTRQRLWAESLGWSIESLANYYRSLHETKQGC